MFTETPMSLKQSLKVFAVHTCAWMMVLQMIPPAIAANSFPVPLSKPEITVRNINPRYVEISWTRVTGAKSYWLQVTNNPEYDPANGNYRCTIGSVSGGITCPGTGVVTGTPSTNGWTDKTNSSISNLQCATKYFAHVLSAAENSSSGWSESSRAFTTLPCTNSPTPTNVPPQTIPPTTTPNPTPPPPASPPARTDSPENVKPPAIVRLVTPNGGETINQGQIYRITWAYSPDIESATLALAEPNGTLHFFATNINNTGYYDWDGNADRTAGDNLKVMIIGYGPDAGSVTDYSDSPIRILTVSGGGSGFGGNDIVTPTPTPTPDNQITPTPESTLTTVTPRPTNEPAGGGHGSGKPEFSTEKYDDSTVGIYYVTWLTNQGNNVNDGYASGDFDGNGSVDGSDLNKLVTNYQTWYALGNN